MIAVGIGIIAAIVTYQIMVIIFIILEIFIIFINIIIVIVFITIIILVIILIILIIVIIFIITTILIIIWILMICNSITIITMNVLIGKVSAVTNINICSVNRWRKLLGRMGCVGCRDESMCIWLEPDVGEEIGLCASSSDIMGNNLISTSTEIHAVIVAVNWDLGNGRISRDDAIVMRGCRGTSGWTTGGVLGFCFCICFVFCSPFGLADCFGFPDVFAFFCCCSG